MSIAAGASLGDQEAGGAVDQQVEVDQPEADRHRQHQQQHPAHVDVAERLADPAGERRLQRPPQPVRRVAEVEEQDRELDHGADEDADRVGVDLVALGERRREADEHDDDRHVPEERRDREGAEAVVAVEDADDHPGDPEQDQDREQDPREVTVRSVTASSEAGTNSGISTGAIRMKSAVSAPRTRVTTKIRLVASANASRLSPRSSFSVNTGTNAAWIAASANRLRTRFGTWKAIVNADIAPLTPK